MELPDDIIARLPQRHQVSAPTFAAVWTEAEILYARAVDPASRDYLEGVITTCRWLAALSLADSRSLALGPAVAPSGRPEAVLPETVEAESVAARRRRAAARRKKETGDRDHGVVVTFEWVRGGPAPVDDTYRELFEALN